jgi:hypothetical protein
MWICRDQAFEPIIEPAIFGRAQEIIAGRHRSFTDGEMLDLLRRLLAQHGTLSGVLIDEADDMPSSAAYRNRFKGLLRAYQLIGYTPQRDHAYVEINRRLRDYHRTQVESILSEIQAAGASVRVDPATDLLTINDEFTASLVLARCREVGAGSLRWLFRLDTSLSPDITIAARLERGNEAILDYYLLPSIDALAESIRLAPENGLLLDVYRFEDLSVFYGLAHRRVVEEVA